MRVSLHELKKQKVNEHILRELHLSSLITKHKYRAATYFQRIIFMTLIQKKKKRNPSDTELVKRNTGLFVSPSGISELDCATTKTDTAERSTSIGRETLQVFFCTRGLGVLPGSTATG